MLTKIYHPDIRNERCAIGGTSYTIDQTGHALVHPQHAKTLAKVSGYEIVQESVPVDSAQMRGEKVRFPQTPDEFVDLVVSLGLSAKDLRDVADMLDPPARVSVVPADAAPLPAAIGDEPKPEVRVSNTDDADDDTAAEKTDDAGEDRQLPEGLTDIRLSMTKKELLAVGQQIEAEVSPDMNKRDIFTAIRRHVVQQYGQLPG